MKLSSRPTDEKSEIIQALSSAMLNQAELTVWQNLGGHRIINKAFIYDIDKESGLMTLMPFSQTRWPIPFQKNYMVYVKNSDATLLFKQGKVGINSGMILLPIPDEIRLNERRKHPRLTFDPFLTEEMLTIKKPAGPEMGKLLKASLFDISRKGIAFRASENIAKLFYRDDSVIVQNVGGVELFAKARVSYLNAYNYMDNGAIRKDFRIGLIFDSFMKRSRFIRLQQL